MREKKIRFENLGQSKEVLTYFYGQSKLPSFAFSDFHTKDNQFQSLHSNFLTTGTSPLG